ncbi:cytochrome P450 [Streptomyces sp. NPDC057456]|uniref:cytochrome P450 n=1 Tax=Streptomyces sp. NPDC057456 TaxID=3346139 RepID=UPI0036CD1CFF
MGDARESVRKVERGPGRPGCPVHRGADGTWEVRGYEAAREVLRATDTVQAGLGVETVEKLPARVRRPVLYQDGPGHREQRRQTARFFTPRHVDEHYRELMTRVAEEQTAVLRAAGTAQLSDLSFTMAIEVVRDILGLTHSRPGLKSRLERFFPEEFGQPGFTSPRGLYWLLRQNANWLRIHLADVRPAIRAHRKREGERDDLISHLLAEGCSGAEILGECLTYAAAGMVTTREFICVAAWHLFDDPELLGRYRAAEEPERLELLREILRLEPVVGRLSRRATAPMRVGEASIGPGELLTVFVDEANADPDAVGRDPDLLRPGRSWNPGPGPGPAGLAFGDGAHRCPGAAVAVLEADVLLSRLFALDGLRMSGRPRVSFKDEIGGYEIRELTVTVPRSAR